MFVNVVEGRLTVRNDYGMTIGEFAGSGQRDLANFIAPWPEVRVGVAAILLAGGPAFGTTAEEFLSGLASDRGAVEGEAIRRVDYGRHMRTFMS